MNTLFIILGVVGPTEIILILAIVLLLFGGKKLPELMKGLGSGIKEFKKASQGDYDDKEEGKKTVIKDENTPAEKK
jgi:sec-independent protein translocase protein TatA